MFARVGQGRGSSVSARWAAYLTACCTLACGAAGQRRGTPLYPEPVKPLSRSEVAVLGGYVAEVDGKDVAEDAADNFLELLPGCHVVRTPPEWTQHDMDAATMVETGVLAFVLPMRGGHSYEVQVVLGGESTTPGTAIVQAIELDAKGAKTQTFSPAQDDSEIEACRD